MHLEVKHSCHETVQHSSENQNVHQNPQLSLSIVRVNWDSSNGVFKNTIWTAEFDVSMSIIRAKQTSGALYTTCLCTGQKKTSAKWQAVKKTMHIFNGKRRYLHAWIPRFPMQNHQNPPWKRIDLLYKQIRMPNLPLTIWIDPERLP